MTLDLNKIKAAAMAATQGEWKAVRSIPEEGFECFWLMHNDAHFGDIHGPQSGQQLADAEHIALASPQAVLELITRLEAAEKDATRYQLLKSIATAQADSNGPIYRIDIRRTCEYLGFNVSVDWLEEMKGSAA